MRLDDECSPSRFWPEAVGVQIDDELPGTGSKC